MFYILSEKLKVLSVLKSGGIYNESHVYALQSMLENNILEYDYDFLCLTDHESLNCNSIKLKHNFQSWWSKIELFNIEPPVLYFDLDTIIINPIDDIINKIKDVDFCGLHDQWFPNTLGSGIMYWSKNMSFIYNDFLHNPLTPIQNMWGDQDFINTLVPNKKYIQDYADGSIVSFKANLNHGKLFNKEKHKIVYFHGKPRPWEQNIIKYI